MTCSLIITTYNWKEALELVLLSLLNQTVYPHEIIVADDGSKKDTKQLIELFQKQYPQMNIIHSWQEDDGFRAAQSRNKAIAMAKGEYIILIDGDIILHNHFIEDHLYHAQKGFFIQGSRVLLTERKSHSILKLKKYDFTFYESGLLNRKNALYSSLLSVLATFTSQSLKGIKTCNMSFFKSDCILVNGFNEEFVGWGREDSEFVVRLMNSGVQRKNVKFNCIAYHIWHIENQRTSLPKNDMLLQKTIHDNLTFCHNGISKYTGTNHDN